MRYVRCVVEPAFDGAPLWQVLEGQLHATRAAVRRAKAQPCGLLVDEKPAYTTLPVRAGQTVALAVGADATENSVLPQPGPLAVVYEDEHLLVVDKPAGIPVHPCRGHPDQTLGNYVLHHLRERGAADARLHPVHRLDLGTSGLVAFVTSAYAFARMQKAQTGASGVFERGYLALCWGVPEPRAGVVDAPIARIDPDLPRRGVVAGGKRAITRYRVAGTAGDIHAAVELALETGRTHQIRVHMAHLGHPLIGDALYGGGPALGLERAALHALRLRLTHPVTEELLEMEAPLPPDLARAVDATSWDWYTS